MTAAAARRVAVKRAITAVDAKEGSEQSCACVGAQPPSCINSSTNALSHNFSTVDCSVALLLAMRRTLSPISKGPPENVQKKARVCRWLSVPVAKRKLMSATIPHMLCLVANSRWQGLKNASRLHHTSFEAQEGMQLVTY